MHAAVELDLIPLCKRRFLRLSSVNSNVIVLEAEAACEYYKSEKHKYVISEYLSSKNRTRPVTPFEAAMVVSAFTSTSAA